MKPQLQKTSDEPLPQVMAGFTAPMRLVDHLHRPKMKLDLVPVLDLFTIGLLISLLFTRFVMVPGVRIDLPDSEMRMPHHDSLVAVLTIGNKGMLYFDGSVYEQSSIKRAFDKHIESRRSEMKNPVLFVKAEGTMPLQSLLELCAMAQEAGFRQVQIAGEKKQAPEKLVPTDALRESLQFTPPVL
ncbi:MAG: ExbD/TolR family protein [Opitutaceae bacterium]